MADIGGWYSFVTAAEEVERQLGVSWGKAQKTVIELCESGAVRLQKRPGGPDVSYNDLRQWLDAELKKERSQPKRNAAKQAIEAIWPSGIPDGLVNKDIEKRVSDLLRERGLTVPGRDTILRAAGRKGKAKTACP